MFFALASYPATDYISVAFVVFIITYLSLWAIAFTAGWLTSLGIRLLPAITFGVGSLSVVSLGYILWRTLCNT